MGLKNLQSQEENLNNLKSHEEAFSSFILGFKLA